ncbi:GNAT family N-acetyltransferase [Paenibacillus sp. BIHB 4019]|uniref:GNAT family N-acetyltransferase n=1 Tax=Paenibacillus sp. BIHB 4019 TaxID=1870819 RepID=A0A1B2DIW9_9BACL|nr:GNAT family N-acetyltransferase [Paenibacillus sp. BIHB 4019]ANY67662.1 GNAT family N-acetyltransferase [Paenibacillus sp. BIHB 4019]
MSHSYHVVRLAKSDKKSFLSVMGSAFAKDPLFIYIFGDPKLDNRARKSTQAFLSFIFDKTFLLNEEIWGIYKKESLLGAYVIETPHKSKLQQINGGLLLLGRLLPLLTRISRKSLGQLNAYMRVTRTAAPALPHHYLIMIGVKPDAQGTGIGKALLLHVLETALADDYSHGVALDTENDDNVNLYRRFAFALSQELQIGHLPVYCMFYKKGQRA